MFDRGESQLSNSASLFRLYSADGKAKNECLASFN
jgi:hypothetical protein